MRVILSEFLKDTNAVEVLDVGCSIGYDCFALAMEKECNVLGIDVDKTSIQLANNIKQVLDCKNTEFQLADIMTGGVEGKQFDVVILFEVLEHIKNDEKALREVLKRLKPNGLLLLSVPYSEKTEEFDDPKAAFELKENAEVEGEFVGGYHWREGYNEKSLATLLDNGGFKLSEFKVVRIPKTIFKHNQNVFAFPLLYPLSRLLSPFSRNNEGLVVKAVKVPNELT